MKHFIAEKVVASPIQPTGNEFLVRKIDAKIKKSTYLMSKTGLRGAQKFEEVGR